MGKGAEYPRNSLRICNFEIRDRVLVVLGT